MVIKKPQAINETGLGFSLLCPNPKYLQGEQEQNHIQELWCALMQIKQLGT